jgi:dTDP-4-dehydrorhamnose reductase
VKILVTGASGLLGERVAKLALEREHEVFATYKEHPVTIGAAIKLDLTDNKEITDLVHKLGPEVIVHTAAYTDVDGCDVNKELARHVNTEATKNLAIASHDIDAHLVYVSTDYVFDGEKGSYREEDTPNPINYYGYTKLMGEEFVKQCAKSWCIARASVIYGWGGSKLNFATWLMENLKQGKKVKVLVDQYVSPTLNTNLAQMLLEIAERRLSGILHTAGADRVSRREFALKLAEVFDLNAELIKPARMCEISWEARRPKDSSLDVSRCSSVLIKSKPMRLEEALEAMRFEKQ